MKPPVSMWTSKNVVLAAIAIALAIWAASECFGVPASTDPMQAAEPFRSGSQASTDLLDLLLLYWFGAVVLGFVMLPVPYLVARYRRHPNALAILILSLLLGWTFLGWAVAMVWAVTATQRRE